MKIIADAHAQLLQRAAVVSLGPKERQAQAYDPPVPARGGKPARAPVVGMRPVCPLFL